jgi:hypothetical protein
MLTRIYHLFMFIFCFFFSSCGIKQGVKSALSPAQLAIPLFVEIPQNDLVFENISLLIYDIFIAHFERVGYKIVTIPSDGYSLRITIKGLEPMYKYVSPDIVLFNAMIKLELFCQLINFNKDIIAKKDFTFTTLISKPKDPILSSDFLDFSYTRLLKKAAPKVEQYFRNFLLKSVD